MGRRPEATVTDVTPEQLHRVSKVIVHPLTVRITHWLNALAMVIMIMSGWRIYNSEPIFPFYFPVELTLGGSYDGSVDLHNEDGLAGALQWHFAGMWLLAINGIVYLAYGIFSGHFRRRSSRLARQPSSATPWRRSDFGCRTGSASTTPCRSPSTSACWPRA
jgi:thiosulfate reductase cytochrome b subunit